MKKKLVLIGGGHAHMMMLAGLRQFIDQGVEVTVIQPSPWHYYSGMGAGMLGGTYSEDEIRFATQRIVEDQGGRFILDRVIRIDPENRRLTLAQSSEQIPYSVLSCNAGSQVREQTIQKIPIRGENIFPVKPIAGLMRAREKIIALAGKRTPRIIVIGGGPSAVEIAGNVRQLSRQHGFAAEITIVCSHQLLGRAPQRVRSLAGRRLAGREITILTNARVSSVEPGTVLLRDNRELAADLIFVAVGVAPSPIFGDSGLPVGPDQGLLVNEFLQSVQYPEIFGGGDCIHFQPSPLDKVGVYAVRQNPVLMHNVLASLAENSGGKSNKKNLQPFDPGGRYLLIYNLGEGYGIFNKWSLSFGGRLPFLLKEYLDRRFMRTYQNPVIS